MKCVAGFLETGERRSFAPLEDVVSSAKGPKPVVSDTALLSLELWRAGKSVDEIAAVRGIAASTVEGHLAQAIANGEALDPRAFYTAAEEKEMGSAFEGYDEEALKPVFEHLGGRIGYGKLRLFRAFEAREMAGV